jgi:L-fuculose-phosphate aldolase
VSAQRQRQAVSEYSALIHRAGWVANHDGNVSMREGGRFFITPTATSKRLCPPDSIVECDLSGKAAGGRGKPPSEVALHAGAYRARADAAAVIHAHPPHASAFALAQRPIPRVAMPEVFVSLGEEIPLVGLYLPKDGAVADAVGAALASADVALLAGNGAISVGVDLEQAFLRMELLEHFAKILAIAGGGIGAPVPLDENERARLIELRREAGLARAPAQVKDERVLRATVREVVAEEVRRVLGVTK